MHGAVLLGLMQIVALALVPLGLVSLFLHARGLLQRAIALGRRVGLVAPLVEQPSGPPLEDLVATLRRLHPAVRSPRPETTTVRQQGIVAAYDGVLVAAAAALDVPTSLADLPDGLDHEAERLRIEHELQRAGLSWQATQSQKPPQAEAE
jgi:hypothetical protein